MQFTLSPPTEATTISALRVLVLAPHYDDEVFGCGGLLAELADSGAEISVLYLTDSSGGDEVTSNREAYAARRRVEAQRGLDRLGVVQLETLPISDGDLRRFVDAAAEHIRKVVAEFRPDLLLSVSPCEITPDHRAAFAALHRALSPLRGGTDLDAAINGCRILLYEVNHPAYPNLLVDVSSRIETITAAINAHESQLELHNYREAALGMRHYRALSLPAGVTAAEGYFELRPLDLATHGLSTLVGRVGGIPDRFEVDDGPLVSVVVRTKDRPDLLAEALGSIAASTYRRIEVVLVNDGGVPPSVSADFPVPVVQVEMGTNRGRAAAANAGVDSATGQHICFLDDDDLVEPEHFETLVALASSAGVRVAYTDAAVGIYELDAAGGWIEVDRRLPYSRDFDPELLVVDNYIPFNTLVIDRDLFAEVGALDPDLEFFEDWDFLIRLAGAAPFHHLPRVTAEYRHFRGSGHHILGEEPRRRADFLAMKARIIERHRDRLGPAVVARIVDGLRSETVEGNEAAAAARRDLEERRVAMDALTDRYHRMNGECEALRAERSIHVSEIERLGTELDEHRRSRDRLQAETERLLHDEKALRAQVGEQDEQLGRVYAEIERLNALIEAMEGTTAWKLHRKVEMLRGRSS
jgi:LmbE family N-acetylglucosaminyl deacetylase